MRGTVYLWPGQISFLVDEHGGGLAPCLSACVGKCRRGDGRLRGKKFLVVNDLELLIGRFVSGATFLCQSTPPSPLLTHRAPWREGNTLWSLGRPLSYDVLWSIVDMFHRLLGWYFRKKTKKNFTTERTPQSVRNNTFLFALYKRVYDKNVSNNNCSVCDGDQIFFFSSAHSSIRLEPIRVRARAGDDTHEFNARIKPTRKRPSFCRLISEHFASTN